MVLWGLKYDPHIEKYNALAKAFNAKTGIEVTIQPQDWPLETKIAAAMSAGTHPDVCCIMGKVLPMLLIKDVVVDITDEVYKTVGTDPQKDWTGDGVPCYTYGGKIYGVPTEFSTISLGLAWPTTDMKYNKITPDEAKNYPPLNGKDQFESYEQMWELAKKLQVEEGGKVLRYGLSSAGWEMSNISSMLAQLGRKWWDEENQKFDFDNDDTVTALDLLVDKPVKMGIEKEQGDTQTNLAQAQKVAIARGNTALIFFLKDINLWYEGAVPPDPDPSKPHKWMGEGGWGFATFKKVKNPGPAIDFLRWMATIEGQQTWMTHYVSNYMVPVPLKAANDHPMWNETGDKYADVVRQMYKRQMKYLDYQTFYGGTYGYIAQVESAVNETCSLVRQQKMTSKEGAKRIQELATNQYEQWKKDMQLA